MAKKTTTKGKKPEATSKPNRRVHLLSLYLEPKFDTFGRTTADSGFRLGVERLMRPKVEKPPTDRRSNAELYAAHPADEARTIAIGQTQNENLTRLAGVLASGMETAGPVKIPFHLARNFHRPVTELELQQAIGKAVIDLLDTFKVQILGENDVKPLLNSTQLARQPKAGKTKKPKQPSAEPAGPDPSFRKIDLDDE